MRNVSHELLLRPDEFFNSHRHIVKVVCQIGKRIAPLKFRVRADPDREIALGKPPRSSTQCSDRPREVPSQPDTNEPASHDERKNPQPENLVVNKRRSRREGACHTITYSFPESLMTRRATRIVPPLDLLSVIHLSLTLSKPIPAIHSGMDGHSALWHQLRRATPEDLHCGRSQKEHR